MHTLDAVVLKEIINRVYNGDSSIPEIPPYATSVVAKSLVVDSTIKLSKHDWKMEQQTLAVCHKVGRLLWKERVLLKCEKVLLMKEGLLYRKVLLKGHDQPIAHFVLPKPFRCKTVVSCNNDFGHMGMERTLGLLQERLFWPKMAAGIREHIITCEMCTCFKLSQERVEMITITGSYHLELVHLDLPTIGNRNDSNKNLSVLVITDHLSRYTGAYLTPKQITPIVA